MGSSQRLNKIETELTPQQAILLWINESHSHGTLESYVKWLSEKSDERSPFRFGEKSIAAIGKSLAKQKPSEKQKVLNQAMQDYEFLYHLFLNLNAHFQSTCREKYFWSQLLIEHLVGLKKPDGVTDLEAIESWKDLFFGFYAETFMENESLRIVMRNHYSGHELLFPDLVFQLGARIRLSHFLHETFNDFFHDQGDITPIDVISFEESLRPQVGAKVKAMADLARAEVLVRWGKREQGLSLVEPYIFS